jgi:hypothetical protein
MSNNIELRDTIPPQLPTVNELSTELTRLERAYNVLTEALANLFSISIEVHTYEDELKMGLYHTKIKITKINGVKLG